MKKIALFIATIICSTTISTNAQIVEWAAGMGGTLGDYGKSICTDTSGNVYTIGNFMGTADFDPGAGTSNLTSASSDDIFIQKLDSSGNLVWAKKMGGGSADAGYAITIDASGNIYSTGTYSGTADFDPGAGTSNLTSAGGYDIFVQKLNSSGDFVWAKQMGGTAESYGKSISVDASGNIYITGNFNGIADFDPGAGTSNLTAAGGYDVFIQKLDSDGNLVWIKQIGGTIDNFGKFITTDTSGNVYTTGYFGGTADFDPGAGTSNLTSAGGSDIFIQKLNSSGDFVWAKQMGGTSDDYGMSICTDASGNVFTTGYFDGTADFDPGVGTSNLTSTASYDIFIQKLDSDGNLIWVKQIGGTSGDYANAIRTDVNGDVYMTGSFSDTVDFDPGAGTSNLISAGSDDIFIHKLDSEGNFAWVKQVGGVADDYGEAISIDAKGNIYTTGSYYGSVGFDPGAGTSNLISAGIDDIFVLKLSQAGFTSPPEPSAIEKNSSDNLKVKLYPNPTANGSLLLLSTNHGITRVEITNMIGAVLQTYPVMNSETSIKINTELLNSGVYIVNMYGSTKLTVKLVKQ